ncbi:MAG: DNA repair protein RecO [Acholeplasmatales bacterium]|nr:DNA repair protein RecO [Acholeplasmatales bacterium]
MKIEGIVVSSVDYKEQSKIVNLYTEIGKIGVKAQGSKKYKNGLLQFTQTGNIVSCILTDNNFKSVLEYELLDSMYLYLNDINVIDTFSKIIDVINSIPEDINHKPVYNFIKKTLNDIKNNNPKKVLCIFLIKILYVFGVAPNLKEDIDTHSKNIKYFDPILGGAKENFGSDTLNIWQEYYYDKKDINSYTECNYDKLYNEIKIYYNYHVPINIKL